LISLSEETAMKNVHCETYSNLADQLYEEIQRQEALAKENPGVMSHLQAQLKLRLIHALITEHRMSCLICEAMEASQVAGAGGSQEVLAVA
jgi:hypothetical protein